jgi:peptide/nickel transport system permease protein
MNYWSDIRTRFWGQKIGKCGTFVLMFFVVLALYAPLFASSKPLFVIWDGHFYFPLFRYWLSSSFYSKPIDLFFNILGIAGVLFLLLRAFSKKVLLWTCAVLLPMVLILFIIFDVYITLDPAHSKVLPPKRQAAYEQALAAQNDLAAQTREAYPFPSLAFDLTYMNNYARLNMVLEPLLHREQHEREAAERGGANLPLYTLYSVHGEREQEQLNALQARLEDGRENYEKTKREEEELRKSHADRGLIQSLVEKNQRYEELQNRLRYIEDKKSYLAREEKEITLRVMPLMRPIHWQDDAGGNGAMNRYVSFLELSRLSRQDLMSGLIFGVRISLFVGLVATLLSLAIGIPCGLVSGYYGGRFDIILCRIVEVWESMPAFFMLLLIVTILQTKSIFLIITVIALFSWTASFRFVRAETLRQRELLYIDACHDLGFSDSRILFTHLFPNAIVPVVALLPFDMMSAITREAGLAFLGLGEEQSCSWGQLMDEGRAAFPSEASLLWPPAIALTLLLIAIAFVGEALHNAMDPKLHQE